MNTHSFFSKEEKKRNVGDFRELARHAMVEIEHFRREELCREIRACFGEKEDLKILDLGCGCGGLGMAIKEAYPSSQVVLTDHKDVLEIARGYGKKKELELHYLEGDFMEEELGKDYDVILASGILNLASNFDFVLEKIHKALSKEGLVFVYSILLDEDPERLRLSKLRWLTASIERGKEPLDKDMMMRGFEKQGFKVVKKTRDGLYPLWILGKEER